MDYPQCQKVAAVSNDQSAIANFILWLEEQGIFLAKWGDQYEQMVRVTESPITLFARYHDIDMNELERERQHILDNLI